MLENFQLASIIKDGAQTRLLRVPLHQELQDSLSESWNVQYEEFVREIQEVEFDSGYQPEEHERFCLANYSPPSWLSGQSSMTISGIDEINGDEAMIDSIKGLVAFVRNEHREELALFQNFTPSQVIRPGRFLFLESGTYRSAPRTGLTLSGKLSAVYKPDENKLLFHNFRTVNTFLPLADFYKEASNEEIKKVLNHRLLAPENREAVVLSANQWSRKRFAMLKDSGVLDNYSAQEIKSRSNGYDVSIKIVDDKIVFPTDKSESKKLLQFLNEERFRGAITDTLYETNSKRKAD